MSGSIKTNLVVIVLVLGATCPSLRAQDSIPAYLDVVRMDLVDLRGQAYELARADALALAPEELDQLIAHMRRADAPISDRVMGWILEGWRDHQEAADEFHSRLTNEIENPTGPITRTRDRAYRISFPDEQSLARRLAFEVTLKLDVPSPMDGLFRWRLGGSRAIDEEVVEPLLVVLRDSELSMWVRRAAVPLLGRAGSRWSDDRIIPALVQFHHELQQLLPQDIIARRGVANALKRIGGDEARNVVEVIVEKERKWMLEHSLTPWDDDGAFLDSARIVSGYSRLQSRANREGWQLTDEQRAAWNAKIEHAERRRHARMLWIALLEAREALGGEPANTNLRDELDELRQEWPIGDTRD